MNRIAAAITIANTHYLQRSEQYALKITFYIFGFQISMLRKIGVSLNGHESYFRISPNLILLDPMGASKFDAEKENDIRRTAAFPL